MKFDVFADITFTKIFTVEAADESAAVKQVNDILGETTRHDICEDVYGWDISDKAIKNVEKGDSV